MYKAIKSSQIPPIQRKERAYAINDVRDFIETGYAAAEVMVPEGKTPKAVFQAY